MIETKRLTGVRIDPDYLERIKQTFPGYQEYVTVPRPPLVLTMQGQDTAPDELHLIASDGTEREFAVVDKARFERLLETAHAAFDARYELELTPELAKAVFAHQHGDLDPLP